MQIPRRRFLQLAAGAAALSAATRIATAEAYPSRSVRIIVGYPPGSGPDITSRLIGEWLSNRLNQPFVIDNRPGASSNIGTEAVVRASPDGYTLLGISSTNASNAALFDKLNFNFIRDIAPVASVGRSPFVMQVHPSFPARTVPEFIAYARANPEKINMASSGNGTLPHLSGELFKMAADINIVHVPYRGGPPALVDLLSGQVQVRFGVISESIEHIKSGKLRALAVTSAARSDLLPDVPSMSEFIPGFEASAWGGVGAPRNTPAEIIQKLNAEINFCLTDPKLEGRLADLGASVFVGTPDDFGKFIVEETEKWGKVIRAANIKVE